MRQYKCMTTESGKIWDYSSFFAVGDSRHKVLHLIAIHLPNVAKKDDKQEDEDRSRKARK